MPSPIFATPGIVTGKRPGMGASPNRAATGAFSDGGTVLYVSRKAAAFGKLRTLSRIAQRDQGHGFAGR
jgi:hypothetical protein